MASMNRMNDDDDETMFHCSFGHLTVVFRKTLTLVIRLGAMNKNKYMWKLLDYADKHKLDTYPGGYFVGHICIHAIT